MVTWARKDNNDRRLEKVNEAIKKMYQGFPTIGFDDQLDVGGLREMEESRLALTFLVLADQIDGGAIHYNVEDLKVLEKKG